MNNNAITITYFDTMRFRIAAVAIDCGGHDVLVFLIFFASFTTLNSVSRRFKNAKWFLNFYRKLFFILDTNNNAITITYFDTMRFRVAAVAVHCGGHDVLSSAFLQVSPIYRSINRFKNAKWFLNFYRKYFFILDTNINAIRKTYFELMRFRVSISDDVVFVQDKI